MNIESNKSVSLPTYITEGTSIISFPESKLRAHAISNQRIPSDHHENKDSVYLVPEYILNDDGEYVEAEPDLAEAERRHEEAVDETYLDTVKFRDEIDGGIIRTDRDYRNYTQEELDALEDE